MAIITDELPLGQVTHGLLNFCFSSTLGQVITHFANCPPTKKQDLLPTACPNKIWTNENSAPSISTFFGPILLLNSRYICGENKKTRKCRLFIQYFTRYRPLKMSSYEVNYQKSRKSGIISVKLCLLFHVMALLVH